MSLGWDLAGRGIWGSYIGSKVEELRRNSAGGCIGGTNIEEPLGGLSKNGIR